MPDKNPKNTIELELCLIIRDPEIQPREKMNQETIVQYSEDMLAGIEFPPAVVYHDSKLDQYWLSQGYHRVGAAELAGLTTMMVEVRPGTRQDALWDAVGSNREWDRAGMKRSNADKRRAVRMALEARPKLTDTAISRQVGVSASHVGHMRKEIYNPFTDDGVREVTRSNGTTHTIQTSGIGRIPSAHTKVAPKTAEPKPEPEPKSESESELEPETKPEPEAEPEAEPALEFEPEPESEGLTVVMLPGFTAEAKVTRHTFNQTNEMVDWARWTWNPVTGCLHGCIYCYARDIANRFYPEKFEPTFRPERLEAPRNTHCPKVAADDGDPVHVMAWKNVFVCSMADLFGRWVPDQWIEDVFTSCRKSPEWNYLFLTKFPQRYVGLDFPETSWVGTSVDEQKRVANAEKAFARIDVPVKWLSVEPMTERIVFNDLSLFDWVVIGGQSRSSGAPEFHPEPWWVIDLAWRAREAGCKVYLKPNTFKDHGWQIKEYPFESSLIGS